MNPEVMPQGRSFKGAWQYYGHDPRQDGEAERYSKDRIGFAFCGNLPTSDPDKAWKCMAWTAKNQTALKKASGQKTTGRKMTKPVYAYVLPWHPEETPTEQEMKAAVWETLKLLKFEEHEFFAYEHTDRPHRHVHVVVNRVHPVTGMDGDIGNDFLKFSEWAETYNRLRGKNYCPQRAINNARRRNGEFVRGSTPKKKRTIQQPSKPQDAIKEREARAGEEKRQRELSEISEQHRKEIAQLATATDTRLTARTDQLRQGYRKKWNDLYKRQAAERLPMTEKRTGLLARFKGWMADRLNAKGVSLPFWLEGIKAQRQQAAQLDRQHRSERAALATNYRDAVSTAKAEIKDAYRLTLRVMEMRQSGADMTHPQDKSPALPPRSALAQQFAQERKRANEPPTPRKDKDRDGPDFDV